MVGINPAPFRADYAGGYGKVGVYDANGVLLGTAHSVGKDELRIDRAESHAALWAASPDMLAALKLVASSGKFNCFDDSAWDVVNDAIAKAEGAA